MGNKKKITPIVIAAMAAVAIVTLATFIIPASASGNPGAGCPSETKFYGTIHGDVYFEQKGYASYKEMTQTFDVPSGTIKLARVYTGFWEGSPGKGGYFNITIQNATGGSYTTDTYRACDPCPNATGCAPYQPCRCDALNASPGVGTCPNQACIDNLAYNQNFDRVNIRDYIVGCGVQFVSFNATPYITTGTNTITVRGAPCPDCCRGGWDGRIYLIALLVVYENSSMPEITYWINEGGLYLEKGSDCDGPDDHFYASKYFNGTHISNPERVKLWSLGWPHVINATVLPAYTELNGNNISIPDITESYGGGYSEVMLRWNNIPTSYLDSSSNFLEYYDPEPLYERAFVEVLIVREHIEADLQVTNIEFPTMMRPDKDYTITARVDNYGDEDAGAFNVSLEVERGGYTYYSDKKNVSGGLNAGDYTTVSFTNVNLPAGCYNFTVTADCDNSVNEWSDKNNQKTAKYQVGYYIVVRSNSDFEELNVSGSAALPSGCFVNKSGTYYIQNLDIENCAGRGIDIQNTNVPFVITNCTVHDCLECGIYFHSVSSGKVNDSEVTGCKLKGIRMMNTSDVIIENNYVHDNLKYGIDIYPSVMPHPDCKYVTVRNNTIVRNLYGIELLGDYCTLCDNLILNTTAYGGGESGWGIYVAGTHNKIYNNTIKYSHSYGMYVDYDRDCLQTRENCIFGNTFVDNLQNISHTSQAYDSSSTHGAYNYWNSTVKLGYYNDTGSPFDSYIGNYWCDYESRYPGAGEVDGSEIWNTPYEIDGGTMKDNSPLMKPWANYERILCGDVNCNDAVNVPDALKLYNNVDTPEQLCSLWAADVNHNGAVNVPDALKLYSNVDTPEMLSCYTGCE